MIYYDTTLDILITVGFDLDHAIVGYGFTHMVTTRGVFNYLVKNKRLVKIGVL
jgi:hypothetical protein